MHGEQELVALFQGDENHVFERKSLWRSDSAAPIICAFANDLSDSQTPGILFIGQENDRRCANLSVDEKLLNTIADLRNNILPSPVIGIERRTIAGCALIVVTVQPAQLPPVRYKGCCYVRVGASTRIASAEEEEALIQKKNRNIKNKWYFERQKPHIVIPLDDLDWLFIEREYLPHAISAETLAENNRSREMQLSSLRFLTEDGAPNNAAVLCFYPNPRECLPGAYIQFARFVGDSLDSEIIDQKEIHGPIFQQIRMVEEKINAHLGISAVIGSGLRAEAANYPLSAINQLVRNAVMHRSYENTNAPVRLFWFSDRIEIHSPGGVFGNVNKTNFGDGATTDYRNPLLAEALKVEKYVEKFGAGIGIIKESMHKNGNPPPIFDSEENFVMVTLRRKCS